LEEVPWHGGHVLNARGKGTKCGDFIIDGFEEGEGVFRSEGFDGFAEAVDVVLSCRVCGEGIRGQKMFEEMGYCVDDVPSGMILVILFRP
jgi:hypothetical protein